MERILELARWAPSGDNTQVWRFQIIHPTYVVVHGFDTREHCVYDFQGRPSQMSLGALIENIVLAAGAHQLAAKVTRRVECPAQRPTFDIRFVHDPDLVPDPLAEAITRRSVQRKALQTRPLSQAEKTALEAAAGSAHSIVWLEGFRLRWRTARLLFANAGIRLDMPEAYAVHKKIIQWNARFSEDRVPDQALGAPPSTLRLMHWAMHSWERIHFLNTWLGGTIMPRLQMDFIPGMACAAHFAICARGKPDGIDDCVAAGRAMQRFWLSATRLGLQMQPAMTPLIFAWYARAGVRFSQSEALWERALAVTASLEHLLGEDVSKRAAFFGRVGAGPAAQARSTRLPLDRLRYLPLQDD